MPDYSEEDSQYARRIVESLLDDEGDSVELEGTLVISDLEADASEFSADLKFLKRIDADVPAIRVADNELVPIALHIVDGANMHFPSFSSLVLGRIHPAFEKLARDYFRLLYKRKGRYGDIESMPREKARSTFLTRATEFLATRRAAVRKPESDQPSKSSPPKSILKVLQRVRGPRVPTPGCNFTVSSDTSGLRVLWSGAYRISPNYFGHPTTPTMSVLQSGIYVFGVDGGAYGNVIQWDKNAVVSLPGKSSTHLQY